MQPETGRSFRHRFEGPRFRKILVGGLRRIPQPLQRATMPMWAGLFYTLVPEARRVVERNLEQVEGPLPPRLAKLRSYRLFVNYAHAITHLYSLHLGLPLSIDVTTSGGELLVQYKNEMRGAVLCTGHMGNWQIAPFLMSKKPQYAPMTMAMAEEPNRQLAEFEDELRRKFRIVYTTSSPFAMLELAGILRRGELVGMQIDRHLGGASVSLPFCGRPAIFPLAPATLARAAEAPLVPVFILSSADHRHCTFHVEQPIEIRRTHDREEDARLAMAEVVKVYERYVKCHSDQWFNFYDFWRAPDTLTQKEEQ
jgi:lauroyl/myristoyl acyltransferase